ncbi:helix-turn-helix transcriptional regulator [Paenibacillus eucommiae]|uniref:AraC-like DNA-binding protein n=1 Tax=Paenibacillus eucommiae TaxID=1355755 RepID=A0ABS4IY17_9BACL|nr:AraC family transcriptional regulator [Paenibacillus eucommiae]MBP1992482.1 AraC-like DNA-binding protein [Paenibacillus eucommiae]
MRELYANLHQAINYRHSVTHTPPGVEFHQHLELFEIYFFISGNVHYFIEKQVYPLQYGDLLLLNSSELHKATFQSNHRYEVIVIHFSPAVIVPLCSDRFDLLACFLNRPPGEQNRMRFSTQQLEELLLIFERLEAYNKPEAAEGSEILYVAAFMELLVFLNRAFTSQLHGEEPPPIPGKLSTLLHYIDLHLDQDLSLDTLEHIVFMNRSYLCRLFKKHTGRTIHEHILFKRIARAKALLKAGSNVTDACQLSGFNDYSNFIRTFKKAVGLPPRQYQALNCKEY